MSTVSHAEISSEEEIEKVGEEGIYNIPKNKKLNC